LVLDAGEAVAFVFVNLEGRLHRRFLDASAYLLGFGFGTAGGRGRRLEEERGFDFVDEEDG